MSENRLCFRSLCVVLGLLLLPNLVHGFSSGPPNGVTGAPGEGSCIDCHSGFPLNSGPGWLVIAGPPAFEPGLTYPVTITLLQDGPLRWGFEFSPLVVGSCTITDPTTTQLEMENGKTYVKHTSAGTYEGSPGPTTWSFDWTAPVDAPETITFYAAGNAADNDGSTGGDYIYTTTYTMGLVPVELTRFMAEVRGREVILRWRTLSELDNMGFRVYRSEGEQFQLITDDLIPGAGTTSLASDYSFTDRDLAEGETYRYRLSDVSLDGSETFHTPTEVLIPESGEVALRVRISPNPVQSGADIRFYLPEPMFGRVAIHDLSGRTLVTLAASDVAQGPNTERLDLERFGAARLGPGLYICSVHAGNMTATSPLLVVP